jgi:SAM-dependent methyltransferase
MITTDSYQTRFQSVDAAKSYNDSEYAPASYSTLVWQEQKLFLREWLRNITQNHAKVRHLDFACGTGRITQLLEENFDQIDALDISSDMVALARAQCPKTQFFVGDILSEPELCRGPYTSITAFRLVLNLDPPLRVPILRELHSRLTPDGTLILNMHGNSQSMRQPAILWKRWKHSGARRGTIMLNSMSLAEISSCLEAAGFQIRERLGFGVLPPTFYRLPLRRFWIALDRMLSRLPVLLPCCVDLMFQCSVRPSDK